MNQPNLMLLTLLNSKARKVALSLGIKIFNDNQMIQILSNFLRAKVTKVALLSVKIKN